MTLVNLRVHKRNYPYQLSGPRQRAGDEAEDEAGDRVRDRVGDVVGDRLASQARPTVQEITSLAVTIL